MDIEIKPIAPFYVRGLQTRTSNRAEQVAHTAKIGALWQRYFMSPSAAAGAVYGVYSGYESDWTGEFDVLAGRQAEADGAAQADEVMIEVQGGSYWVFRAKGAMPQAVIEAWGQVWAHFATPRGDWQRCYGTDFEQYIAADEVAVCIGVKPV